ncbi:SigE family RNA polymerase sigma factor [Nocardioides sp. LHD-245]|uniref:SigE family RNA polymerase sigma factor n=1 Tax=Nocardioides sp. LHD-245 TaxID=3051387 RepID=UPI0027E158B7|nr:SigE family RNA polymerase sigma factor [Nocardioides sp. LHD-245]
MDDEFSAWAAGAEAPLLRSAYLLTGDLHRAEDLVQEALVKVALRWRRLRSGHPTAYARRVIARDHVSLWRRNGREVPASDPVARSAAVSSDPDAVLVVQKALARLTSAQRAVVVLRHFDDLTERETAEVLGVAIGTVKSQNAAALARLRTGAPELLDLVRPAARGEAAVREARRRRTQQRVVGGAALAVVLIVLLGVLVTRQGGDAEPPPVAPTSGTTGVTETAVEARIDAWDPLTLAAAPVRPSLLPRRVDPPASAPSIRDRLPGRALLAWPRPNRDVLLLGDDEQWSSVPDTSDKVTTALSYDGRRLALGTAAGVRVVDLSTGDDAVLPWPDSLAGPWDATPELRWLPGGEELAVLHWRDTWVMGLDGSSRKPPWGAGYGLGLGIDPRPGGDVVEQPEAFAGFDVWQGDSEVRSLPSNLWTNSVALGYGRVAAVGAGTRLPTEETGPLLLDAATGELLAAATAPDPNGVYGNGQYLSVVDLLDADTVLLRASPVSEPTIEPADETWYLAVWHADTGSFERLTSGSAALREASVAVGTLAGP